jgi:hypothetical protein
MHIDEQILLVDGDLDPIPPFQFRQFLGFSHPHGDEPRRPLTGMDSCLFASDFLYRAN